MISGVERLFELRDRIVRALRTVEDEPSSLDDAKGRWLSKPVHAALASPPETCSAMDGYAVRASTVRGTVALRLRTTIFAGGPRAPPLGEGESDRILTGGTLPPGADAVVREEAVEADGERVVLHSPVRVGENVRTAGEDVPVGGLALPAGARLGPRQLALLRAVGAEDVRVYRRPLVRVISTGDELVSGRTPDSNGLAVAWLCRSVGAMVSRELSADRIEALREALGAAEASADLILTIGGVSVGERDLVPKALSELGAEVRVHGVPMKPGKPFLFALLGEKPMMGLPGSPSACLAAFEMFARPALLALCGAAKTVRTELALPLAEPVEGRPGRVRLHWAKLEPGGRARPLGRDAAQIRGPALADLLILIPRGAGSLPAGTEVSAWLLDDA
ncbi:MAG TPA: molybdopterin molybdotransferase MoeA [Anaeromyxobacter sp.]|nr:molybdopterin molybdotransferase MoeA [Anaeromyxobacter sp.]